ncbi:ead/Ea22-like family protein [Escherichia coli]
MSEIDYQALREAAQNYQLTLAWYQEKPDSPNAEQDCDAALAAFKREIRHREVEIIAGLLDELDEKQQYIKSRDLENEDIALTVGKLRVELEAAKSKQPISVVPEGLVRAVRFYEQVKRENPSVETGAWKDAVDWVLKEACQVVNTGTKGG